MNDLHVFTRKLRALVWQQDLRRQPVWSAIMLRLLRTMWAVIRDFRAGDINLRAMSLVYTTMLSLVPLLAVSFSVLKGFGVHEQLEAMLVRSLMPLGDKGVDIGIRIIEFVDNVEVGVLGSVGMALLFYTVLSLMQKIERTFNFIWLVPDVRPFAQRFSGYLSVVLIGPILIFASMGISASLMNSSLVESLTAIEPFGTSLRAIGTLAPFGLAVTAFTAIYILMPNTRVRLGSAAYGAVIAGLLWNVAGWMFATLVVSSAQYTAIYSAFAALVVFMLWLYVAWLVLLLGASVAFYHQHPEHLTLERGEPVLSPRMAEGLALAMAAEIAADYVNQQGQPGTEDLARRLDIPATTADRLVRLLSDEGFIIAADGASTGWLPAMPTESIKLAAIIDAVRASGETAPLSSDQFPLRYGIEQVIRDIDNARAEALAGRSLADIIAADPEEESGAISQMRKIR